MADALLYEQSLETQGGSEPFISRQVVQVLDQNGGNYNGQIQIDTSSLSNSGKYASYSEAYLVLPLVTVIEATTANAKVALNAAANPFLAGLKNGHHQLIHSLSVSYNNSDVVQLTPYTNFYVSYKLMTQLSWEDVKKIGPSIGFCPDTSVSYQYQREATSSNFLGQGVVNNSSYGNDLGATKTNFGTFAKNQFNEGLIRRQLDTSFTLEAPYTSFVDGSTDTGISLFGTGTNYQYWYTLAKIRLKDLHSFFEQLPLVKGAFITLRINTNTVTHTIGSTTSSPASTANLYCSSSVINGGTSPLIFSSGVVDGDGSYPLNSKLKLVNEAADQTFSFRLSIGKDTSLGLTHPTWQAQTRLFVPMYQMSPVDEEKYLSINRTKRVVYEDIYSYQTNVDAGATFNQLLTNGIPNPTSVICIPFIQGADNCIGKTTNLNPTPTFQSPFTTEPATTSPLVILRDFNVQVAGLNMFVQNQIYDFEQFMNELQSKNAINGGLVNGLTSGLISEIDFKHMYRYYVCDVSRRLSAEDSVPKSVSIQGKNLSLKKITIYTFILFRREITIDLATGQKLD